MMDEVGAFDAKNRFSELLERAESGEEVIITRRGKPVAKLGPIAASDEDSRALAAVERIRARARKFGLGSFDWEEEKKRRDEGRP